MLNQKLFDIQVAIEDAQRLAAKHHEWDAASRLAEAREQVAQARKNSRETAIADCDRFIHAARLSMS